MILNNAYSIRVPSPDGVVTVHCTEENGHLDHIIINIGKAGHSVASWADALSRVVTIALRQNDLSVVLEALSNISSGKSTYFNNQYVKSAPDAVFRALLMYRNLKTPKNEPTPPRASIPANW